jgi:hypothetical protein
MHRFIKQLRYTAKLINPILVTFNQLGRIALLVMAFSHHPAASAPDLTSNISAPSIQAGR